MYRDSYVLPEQLTDLAGPTSGVVTLPNRLDWTPVNTYSLETPTRVVTLYRTVLREARRVSDLEYLNGEKLVELWPDLLVPTKLRDQWQEKFPELAGNPGMDFA